MQYLGARAIALAVLFATGAAGCANMDTDTGEGLDSNEHVTTPIVGGEPAAAYPEAVLIEMSKPGGGRAACSGSVIAPKVVLTAGHCVSGYVGWTVRAPLLGQSSTAATAETFDWKDDGSKNVNGSQHDIGLVYLDSAITTAQYPVLADKPVANGSSVVTVGRIDDGAFSNTGLFVSKPLPVIAANLAGYPYSYGSEQVIESGDSGGPVEVPGTTPHLLVAVNSGAGGGTQVLARVDLLKAWITERIAAHGGAGAPAPAPTPAPAPAPTPAPAAPAACSGPAEVEPNDDFRVPNALAASSCGSLSGADAQDWYTWSIAGATPYALELETKGDAVVVMFKKVNGKYARVANTTMTSIAHTASGAGSYLVAVFTPGGAAQPYQLTLQK